MTTITLPGALPILTAGQIVDAADMNAMTSAANFISGKPVCVLQTPSAGQSIPTTANTTPVVWTEAEIDNSGMYNASSPTIVTIQVPGWYRICYSVTIASGANSVAYNGYVSQTGGSSTGNYLGSYCESLAGALPLVAMGASGLWPFYLTEGATLSVWMQAGETGTYTSSIYSSYLSLEYASM